MSLFALSIFVAAALPAAFQGDTAKQLDFWVGDWNCVGKSRDEPGKDKWTDTVAKNHIERILGSKVIQENFTMEGLVGKSVSVYDEKAKVWRQTWVDDSGSYIALTGGMQDGKMILVTLPNKERPKASNRMVFDNVTKDSFDWNWEGSRDGGKTWNLSWHLHYTRATK